MSSAEKNSRNNRFRTQKVHFGLAWKITIWYMLLLLFTVIVLSGLTYWGNHQDLLKEKAQILENTVTRVIYSLNESNEKNSMDIDDPGLLSSNLAKGVSLQITSTTGKVLSHTGKTILPVAQDAGPEIRNLNGDEVYYLASPIQIKGKTVGYIQGTIDLEEIESAEKILIRQLLLLGFSGCILAALGGLFLSRQVLSPLEKLNRAVSQFTANDLHKRLPVKGNGDELDRLGENFNKMMQRLEKSFTQQKQFVADASHELRTPLMVIRGHADILQRWGADDPTIVRDSASAIGEEVGLMTKLVERLLTLARGDLTLNLAPVNLSELVIDSTAGLPFLSSFTIEYDISPDIMVYGDALYLRQVLRIIMENAGKYVPAKGRINMILQAEGDKVKLSIEDNGPGIPPEALENIFNRFYRVDQARSRRVSGYGLGLSIARMVIEQHQGKIWAENVEPHGARFCIELNKIHSDSSRQNG